VLSSDFYDSMQFGIYPRHVCVRPAEAYAESPRHHLAACPGGGVPGGEPPESGKPVNSPPRRRQLPLNFVTLALIILGAVNWGLVGLFQLDLVAAIFGGQDAVLARLVYIVMGASGLYHIVPLINSLSSDRDTTQPAHPHR
jgi:uncharacterized protein